MLFLFRQISNMHSQFILEGTFMQDQTSERLQVVIQIHL